MMAPLAIGAGRIHLAHRRSGAERHLLESSKPAARAFFWPGFCCSHSWQCVRDFISVRTISSSCCRRCHYSLALPLPRRLANFKVATKPARGGFCRYCFLRLPSPIRWWRRATFFSIWTLLAACQSLYAPNPFPEAPKIGEYIKAHTSPDARIAVLGSEPEIFFYAQRHSATGYIYVYPLMENQKYARTMQNEMISEIERAKPEFVVQVNVPFSWVVRPDSDTRILSWSQKFVQEHYDLDGVVDILQQSEYRWGQEAKAYQPTSTYTVQIFQRRTN